MTTTQVVETSVIVRNSPAENYARSKDTVFIRLNAAAFIKFLAFPMRRVFKGGVYFEIIFFKSLTINLLKKLCNLKVQMSPSFCLQKS